MTSSPWPQRIQRAEELIQQHDFAVEILNFYIQLTTFQERLQGELNQRSPQRTAIDDELTEAEVSDLTSGFESFLAFIKEFGPKQLVEVSEELRARGPKFWSHFLRESWSAPLPSSPSGFLAQAFLQPYAELSRSRAAKRSPHAYAICPFCGRKPICGVLRPMGEGGARSMVCSFCSAEWDFRRLVCPGCGEENDRKLPIFTADQFPYIRVECCESCKTYLKTIDLTKNGHAEPVVDELAAVPLDLWAQERGYAKLQKNILGM
jgi:FdhE protein